MMRLMWRQKLKPRWSDVKIIISPAKRMKEDTDAMPVLGVPPFPEKTAQLQAYLRQLSPSELQAFLQCNARLAEENYRRYQDMDRNKPATPAIFAYQGIQYQYMAPTAFTDTQYRYIQEHLRILSGLYGCLRPFDGVVPYRLEMQAKSEYFGDLYRFWGTDLGQYLSRDNDLVIDLASEEYSRAARQGISPTLRWIRLRFGRVQNGKFREAGTQVKMARGAMVRDMAERNVQTPEELIRFTGLGYRFAPERSEQDLLVFVQEDCE